MDYRKELTRLTFLIASMQTATTANEENRLMAEIKHYSANCRKQLIAEPPICSISKPIINKYE